VGIWIMDFPVGYRANQGQKILELSLDPKQCQLDRLTTLSRSLLAAESISESGKFFPPGEGVLFGLR